MKADLSAHAVSSRVRRVSQLRHLCLSLKRATGLRTPDPSELPVPESHKRALDDALADHLRDPEAGRSWDEVREDLPGKR